jgi:hypothetical protein
MRLFLFSQSFGWLYHRGLGFEEQMHIRLGIVRVHGPRCQQCSHQPEPGTPSLSIGKALVLC